MKLIVLQIGRPILDSVKSFFSKEADTVLTYAEISPSDYPQLAKNFYNALSSTVENHVVLSGPVSLNFVLGQLVGLNHFKIVLYQRNNELMEYQQLPNIGRNVLL